MINEKLAKEKGLITKEDKSKYDNLVKDYKYLLEYYINSIIDLSKYDDGIKNSGLYIGINPKYKSLNEYLKLDYLFLINRLFVEKLSVEDIKLMDNFNKENITDELIKMVEKTYKDVIYSNYIDGEYKDIVCKTCYGPVVPFNFVDNDSLVLKIYYGKNLTNADGEEFIKLHENQLAFFHKLIDQIKKDFKEKLDIKCEVLLEKDLY